MKKSWRKTVSPLLTCSSLIYPGQVTLWNLCGSWVAKVFNGFFQVLLKRTSELNHSKGFWFFYLPWNTIMCFFVNRVLFLKVVVVSRVSHLAQQLWVQPPTRGSTVPINVEDESEMIMGFNNDDVVYVWRKITPPLICTLKGRNNRGSASCSKERNCYNLTQVKEVMMMPMRKKQCRKD